MHDIPIRHARPDWLAYTSRSSHSDSHGQGAPSSLPARHGVVRKVGWRRRSTVAMLLCSELLVACSGRSRPLDQWELGLGGAIGQLLIKADTVAVLFYDPGDCFSCSSPVAEWLAWADRSKSRVVEIVLSRRPSEAEGQAIAAYRVRGVPCGSRC